MRSPINYFHDQAQRIRGPVTCERIYPLALLIIFRAYKTGEKYGFLNLENTRKTYLENMGPNDLTKKQYESLQYLARNIIKFHERFDNLPSDKLAKEWLDEVLNE